MALFGAGFWHVVIAVADLVRQTRRLLGKSGAT
jgi:hypothetical protein